MKTEEIATHVGNKVLPITHDSAQSSISGNNLDSDQRKGKIKEDKTRVISRMRELMKWAAFAKGGKHGIGRKVLNFKMKRAALKSVPDDDDQFSNESPKISFRWDVESCSTTTSSLYSAISMASSSLKNIDQIQLGTADYAPLNSTTDLLHDGNGNWITTDSEFVVLEL